MLFGPIHPIPASYISIRISGSTQGNRANDYHPSFGIIAVETLRLLVENAGQLEEGGGVVVDGDGQVVTEGMK